MKTNAPAELLGRHRIRERHEDLAEGGRLRTGGVAFRKFTFDEPAALTPMVPTRALEYFRSLTPGINVDPAAWANGLERKAFTLAVTADEVVLGKVQEVIAQALETGETRTAIEDIDSILDAAGVGEREAGYSETVFRTNMMSNYNAGAQAEALEVADTFPIWRYSNPDDGRSRPWHAEKDGNYYYNAPGSTFEEVRGEEDRDIFNCRCVPIFIDRKEADELFASGVTVQTEW
jgi:hypothetical protein